MAGPSYSYMESARAANRKALGLAGWQEDLQEAVAKARGEVEEARTDPTVQRIVGGAQQVMQQLQPKRPPGFWDRLSTLGKAVVVGAGLGLGYLAWRAFR